MELVWCKRLQWCNSRGSVGVMHGQYCGQVSNRWFAGWVPISNDCSLRTQHIKLGFASSREIGMNKSGLLAGRECDRDMRMISICRVCPYALVVLSTDMGYIVRNDVQYLIEKMTAPIKNCSARYFGV